MGLKRKVVFHGNPFWECRVKRFRGYWGCIKKQVTTAFYEKPADEVIAKFKTKREASIFADIVNVKYSILWFYWKEQEGVSDGVACKSFNARHRLNEILFLVVSGYSLKDLVNYRCTRFGLYTSHKALHPNGTNVDCKYLLEVYKEGTELDGLYGVLENILCQD